MASKIIAIRLPDKVIEQAKDKAKEMGYIKPNGEPNVSEYIRNLIINDKR